MKNNGKKAVKLERGDIERMLERTARRGGAGVAAPCLPALAADLCAGLPTRRLPDTATRLLSTACLLMAGANVAPLAAKTPQGMPTSANASVTVQCNSECSADAVVADAKEWFHFKGV